jgi:hypothetical protein
MEFKKGFKIKPKSIKRTGEVIFTDGTNDVFANQKICQEYGYNYDTSNGTCYAYRYVSLTEKRGKNLDNKVAGKNNLTSDGTKASFITGQSNSTDGSNKNILITGENNRIQSNLSNSSIIGGTHALGFHNGEVVIGAGLLDDGQVGAHQMAIVQLIGQTGNAVATNLSILNENDYIEVQNNSILGFEAHIIALCTGGSGGTAGQYIYYKLVGACKTDNGFNLTITQSISTIADGSLSIEDAPSFQAVTDPFISIQVVGLANVNISWYASVSLFTNKTLNTF